MTIIKVTSVRAIIVEDSHFALARWTKKFRTLPDKTKEEYYDWEQYKWTNSMERAVNLLTQELISQRDTTMTMKQFLEAWGVYVDDIKQTIYGSEISA